MEIYTIEEKNLCLRNINEIKNNHKILQNILNKNDISYDDRNSILFMNKKNTLLLQEICGDLKDNIDNILNDEMNNYYCNNRYADRIFKYILKTQTNNKCNTICEIISAYGSDDDDVNNGIKLYINSIINEKSNNFKIVDILQKNIPLFNIEICDNLRDILTTNVKVYLTTGKIIEDKLYQFFNETLEDKIFWKIIMLYKKYNNFDYKGIDEGKTLLEQLLWHSDIRQLIISNMRKEYQNTLIKIEVLDEF